MSERVLVVPGPPVPWASKTVNQKTGNRFLPGRQSEAIGRVLDVLERFGLEPFPADVPIELDATFWIKRPKSHYGSGRNAAQIKERFLGARPTGMPDLSNLTKLIEDAVVLGGLLPDDDQVVRIRAEKFYTDTREEQPRTVARFREVA